MICNNVLTVVQNQHDYSNAMQCIKCISRDVICIKIGFGLIRRSCGWRVIAVAKALYVYLVSPHLDNASQVWSHSLQTTCEEDWSDIIIF